MSTFRFCPPSKHLQLRPRDLFSAVLLSSASAGACTQVGASPQGLSLHQPPSGDVRPFSFVTTDGTYVASATLRGRITIVVFITTYDLLSQAQLRFVAELVREHKPRLNALALALEPAENLPLAQAMSEALHLPFPVAFADAETIAKSDAFGISATPSLVILTRDGRASWRRTGLVDKRQIEAALAGIDQVR